LAITVNSFDSSDYSDHFNCITKYEGTSAVGTECCGYNGLGEKHCSDESEWEEYEGKYRRCAKTGGSQPYANPEAMIGQNMDICCDDRNINDCGKCKSFYVWDFLDFDTMDAASTFDTNWRDQYLDQNLDNHDGYDNAIFPGGFIKGTLREFNDPNVCIYIPKAAGKIIEIKVESEESGDRLCIGDLHDESTDRNDPGQNDACSDTNVETCFGDANTSGDPSAGFGFYIFCDEGCEEGGGSGDVPLWVRARFSPNSWIDNGIDGEYLATNNIEMWCEYVNRDYPQYDVYPNDIAKSIPAPIIEEDSSSHLFITLASLLLLLVL